VEVFSRVRNDHFKGLGVELQTKMHPYDRHSRIYTTHYDTYSISLDVGDLWYNNSVNLDSFCNTRMKFTQKRREYYTVSHRLVL
jgi:hypothetical protein